MASSYLRETAMWYGGVGLLTAQVLRSLALPPKYFRLIILEIEALGVRSLGVALTAAIFTGMVFALQSAVNMARFGAESYVGPIAALAILRELGPVLTAILVGGKVASGITAELGSMKVTEQIDALRTLGVNYIKRLVVPRVLAALVVFPMLTVLADVLGVLGGMVIMYLERGADMYAYWNITTYWVVPKDFVTGVAKSIFFGALVTLIGCYNGLSTEGGTEGLGRATTAGCESSDAPSSISRRKSCSRSGVGWATCSRAPRCSIRCRSERTSRILCASTPASGRRRSSSASSATCRSWASRVKSCRSCR